MTTFNKLKIGDYFFDAESREYYRKSSHRSAEQDSADSIFAPDDLVEKVLSPREMIKELHKVILYLGEQRETSFSRLATLAGAKDIFQLYSSELKHQEFYE